MGKKRNMLVLLLIPALLAYLRTEYVEKDMYRTRKNACQVLRDYMTLASQKHTVLDHTDTLIASLRKCHSMKQPTIDAITTASLTVLHDALNKKSPVLDRTITDSGDTCNMAAWTQDTSFIKELFATQLDHPALGISHPLVLDCSEGSSVETSLASITSIQTVRRSPLVLVCRAMPHIKVSMDVAFGGQQYTLRILANESNIYKRSRQSWAQVSSASGGLILGTGRPIDIPTLKDILIQKATHIAVYTRI